jgi:hypothetical protein
MSTLIASNSLYDADTYYFLGESIVIISQSFITPSSKYLLDKISFVCKKSGSPTGNLFVKLYAHSGTYGESSLPTGDAIAISSAIDVSNMSTSISAKDAIFDSTYEMLPNTNYVLSIEYSDGSSGNVVTVYDNGFGVDYEGNMAIYNGSWSFPSFGDNFLDISFYVYGTPTSPTISNISQISGIQSITF